MRHGIETIAITTTEQANAWLESLDKQASAARVDDYANERKKPIKWLSCTCCGESLQGRDWWNQEPGYGLCDDCVELCCGDITNGAESSTHGVAGVHFRIAQTERDNPPLVEDRGEPLYGIDERLRIEYDGYVYWRGIQFEHYSHSALYDTEENKAHAKQIIAKCEQLERDGQPVSFSSIYPI